MTTGAELKAALKEYAAIIGLDLIGVAPAAPFSTERERLERRREAGLGPNPFEPQEIPLRVEPDRPPRVTRHCEGAPPAKLPKLRVASLS